MLLKKPKKITDTTQLTKKKSKLLEQLMTEKFITQFNNELNELGASRIKVEIKKTRSSKEKTFFSVKLKGLKGGNNTNITEILSEGEIKIISIAAFLAETTVRNKGAPIIFDDPVSFT